MGQNKIRKNNKINPDSWDIIEEKGHSTLVFYRKDMPIASVPILPETMSSLMLALSSHLIVENEMADSWTYRQPVDPELPDYLTLLKDGKILGTLPIDYKTGKKINESMSKYSVKPKLLTKINTWRKNNKTLFIIVTTVAIVTITSTVIAFVSKLFIA